MRSLSGFFYHGTARLGDLKKGFYFRELLGWLAVVEPEVRVRALMCGCGYRVCIEGVSALVQGLGSCTHGMSCGHTMELRQTCDASTGTKSGLQPLRTWKREPTGHEHQSSLTWVEALRGQYDKNTVRNAALNPKP